MMLAAGDGYYITGANSYINEFDIIIKRPTNMPTDIEFMFNTEGYNIFCCNPLFGDGNIYKNIEYLI